MKRPLRLIHTSDWHLGHRLYGHARDEEHRRFLSFLLDLIVEEDADALVVAGDVFDSANPPAEAQRAYYQFLADCMRRRRDLDLVVIGGNHDSAARLDAPAQILRRLNVHVVGGLRPPEVPADGPALESAADDPERALIPLRQGDEIRAWLVAVPYLRPTDLPSAQQLGLDEQALEAALESDELRLRAVRFVHDRLFQAARAKRAPGQALVAAMHCFLVGGETSTGSERLIQIGKVGTQAPWPLDVVPDDVAYVALGHLHRAQRVGGREQVRYAGSPIPLSLSERDYEHQVLVVDLDGESLLQVRPVRVPRAVDILTVPEVARPLEEVLPLLAALPRRPATDRARAAEAPFLEVRVRRSPESAAVGPKIEEAVRDAQVRLCRIELEPKSPDELLWDEGDPSRDLRDLAPEEVFAQCYRRDLPRDVAPDRAGAADVAAVPEPLRLRFQRLLDAARAGEDARSVLGPAWRGAVEGPT